MKVLGEVLEAVVRRAFTVVDGGISRVSRIVKANALGADLVGMGRLYCYELAAGGAYGIARVVELLEIEVAETLGLLGLSSFQGLDRSYLRAVEALTEPHVLSAFPPRACRRRRGVEVPARSALRIIRRALRT